MTSMAFNICCPVKYNIIIFINFIIKNVDSTVPHYKDRSHSSYVFPDVTRHKKGSLCLKSSHIRTFTHTFLQYLYAALFYHTSFTHWQRGRQGQFRLQGLAQGPSHQCSGWWTTHYLQGHSLLSSVVWLNNSLFAHGSSTKMLGLLCRYVRIEWSQIVNQFTEWP